MRILVTTTTYPKSKDDTSPRFVHDLCKGFLQTGEITPIVLTPHSYRLNTEDTLDNIKIFRYKYFFEKFELISGNGIVSKIKHNPFLFLLIPFLMVFQAIATIRLIKKYNIEIILANWIVPQGFIIVLINKILRRNIKIYNISHGGDAKLLNKNFLFKKIAKFVINNSTRTIVVSSFVEKILLGVSSHTLKLDTIPMGVDTKKFIVSNTKISKRKYDIIFVGRLEEKKGVKVLIESIKELFQENWKLNVLIIGEGTLKKSLQKKVNNHNLGQQITFTGALTHEQIIKYMYQSKIFVLPSINLSYDSEGLPTVLLEAMATGLPIITTNAGGIKDIAINEYNSILVEQNNSKMITSKIKFLLNNPSEIQKLQKNARKTAEEYSYENISSKYISILKELNE